MKRFRLSTLMLLIVIAALSIALMLQQHRASRREAELQGRLAQSWPLFVKRQQTEEQIRTLSIILAKYRKLETKMKSEAEDQSQ
jgi:hypothetical protein